MKAAVLGVRVFDNFPRAEQLHSQDPVPPVSLVFDGRVVKPATDEPGWERIFRDFYRNEAERFRRRLNAVAPGGFVDALFGLMALEKASLFVKVPDAHPLGRERPAPAQEPALPEATPEVVRDILALVTAEEHYPKLEALDIAAWTQEEREAAANWAGAIHLRASDNPAVRVPPRPACVPEWANR